MLVQSPSLIKDCNAICRTANVRQILQCGLACQSDGLFEDACGCYRHVLTLKPKHFDALHMLGVIAMETERPSEAVALIGEALRQKPDIAFAHRNYALALRKVRRANDAIKHYERAISLEPKKCDSYIHLVELLIEAGKSDQALAWCDRAMEHHAQNPLLHLAQAVALRQRGRLDDSLRSCETAITLQPTCAEAWDKRGAALQELARPHESLESYATAIRVRPDFAQAYHHASLVHLQIGQFRPGWDLFEQREQARLDFGRPRWHPSTQASGVRVLLHAEQGLGDTLQFCRYAPLVAESGAQVTLMVQQPLLAIMQTLSADLKVIAETSSPPPSDLQCPLMSLPHAFQTIATTIPAQIPYLVADAGRVLEWRARLGQVGFKIGVCWHGSGLPAAVGRAFPLEMLAHIAQLPGVRLISLQKGPGVEQLNQLPRHMQVETLGAEFDAGETAFMDTAAVMECLDLIITCDTSIVHLAGALGRPTWLALKWVSDWRWLTDCEDTPWYPSVRLFRQTCAGDWHGVFERMRSTLQGQLLV